MRIGAMLDFLIYIADHFRYQLLFFAAAIGFEAGIRSDVVARLYSRSYLLDLLYAAFYRFGIFTLLLVDPVREYLYSHLTVPVFEGVPLWILAGLYLVLNDFASYWIHRLGHASAFFWAFHQVHHSVDQLTMMALYRTHPVDSWLRTVIAPAFFMFLLGVPPALWLPLSIVWDINLNLSHLEVPWTYGPLKWIFVSPVFHSVHHGIEARNHQVNFGMGLSLWDTIFGTADHKSGRPTVVGLPGWSVRESFLPHVWAPIRDLARHYRGLPTKELAPLRSDAPAAAESSAPAAADLEGRSPAQQP